MFISTHVLRMEDDEITANFAAARVISTHVLRMEDDVYHKFGDFAKKYFNPRPPHGGRLLKVRAWAWAYPFQPTSSAWRTTWAACDARIFIRISTHVLRMEDDANGPFSSIDDLIFQPTSSAWRTTSTIALQVRYSRDFNPRPPHGGRLCA